MGVAVSLLEETLERNRALLPLERLLYYGRLEYWKELDMSAEKSVEETVKEIATRILRKQDIDLNSTATFKEVGADSLDIVQMLVALEDTFDIELQDEELKTVTNMKDFVAYIKRKVAEKGK